MFDALISSWIAERRGERLAGTIGSVLLHAAVIGAALLVPRRPPEPPARTVVDTIPVIFEDPPVALPLGVPKGMPSCRCPLPDLPTVAIVDEPLVALPAPANPVSEVFRLPLGTRVGDPAGAPVEAAVVDEPPERLATPPVRYPALLREAGIQGTVLLEFVVDTAGHVEPATVRTLASSHRAFEDPAREAVLASVYRPGRWRGTPVRVLVRQTVAFTIRR